jgi:TPR repeat protein
MIALAHILELGVGVPQDLQRASLLLRRGAYTEDSEGFSSLARYHYGMALMQGRGVDPNSGEAFKWLRRAAAEGVEDAREYLAQHFPHQLPEYHVDSLADSP